MALSGVPFLSIGYRLAPEHPRPQAEDALDGYLWLIGHADELGIDAHRVAIMGDSGRARALRRGPLSSRATEACRWPSRFSSTPCWTTEPWPADDELDGLAARVVRGEQQDGLGGRAGERRGTDEVLPCEAPARNESFEGLAPAFLEVGELDLFRDETIEYAKRLMAAHVPAELHVLTGLTHTFDTFPLPIADKAFEYRSYVISQL